MCKIKLKRSSYFFYDGSVSTNLRTSPIPPDTRYLTLSQVPDNFAHQSSRLGKMGRNHSCLRQVLNLRHVSSHFIDHYFLYPYCPHKCQRSNIPSPASSLPHPIKAQLKSATFTVPSLVHSITIILKSPTIDDFLGGPGIQTDRREKLDFSQAISLKQKLFTENHLLLPNTHLQESQLHTGKICLQSISSRL